MAISTSISSNISTSISTSISSGDEGGWSGLTFTSTGTSTVYVSHNGTTPNCEYSLDKGKTWQTMPTNNADAISFTQIWVRGVNQSGWSIGSGSYTNFVLGGDNVDASGSIMSLIDGKGTTKAFPGTTGIAKVFSGCTTLLSAPRFPATSLNVSCYYRAFEGCTSLTKAPALPATTLASYCYWETFYGCTSLVKAPALPATTLTSNCYEGIFNGCTSLNEVHVSAIDTNAVNCLNDWLTGTAASGTLYTPAYYAGYLPGSTSGCPSGWSRIDAIPVPDTVVFHTMHVNSASSVKVCGNSNKLEALYVNGQSRTPDNSQNLKDGYNHVTLVYDQSLTSLSMYGVFDSCTAIIQCDLSHLTKYPITSITSLFDEDRYMENVIGFEYLKLGDINSTSDSKAVFQNCRALKHLPFNPTLKVIGVAYSNHNYAVEDEEIIIPKCVTTIVPEHAFYALGERSYDETAQRYKVHTFALEPGGSPNHSIGEKGELYTIWNGKKSLVSVPQGWLLTDNTFELASDCNALGALSFSRNYAIQKLVLPDGYETTRTGYGDLSLNDGTSSGLHLAAFTYSSINHIEVSASNPRYSTSGDGLLYSKDGSELICVPYYWPNTNTENPQPLNIPSHVTKIGTGAFIDASGGCRCISEINIGPQVTYIDPEQCAILSVHFASKVNIDPNNAYYEKVNGKIVFKQSHLLTMDVTSPVSLHLDKGTTSVVVQYSTDQTNWMDFPTSATEFSNGTYYLKGSNSAMRGAAFVQDSQSGSFSLSGNLGSLLDGAGKIPFVSTSSAFSYLFCKDGGETGVSALTNLRNLYLPFAYRLDYSMYHYHRTFKGCGASELPSLDWPAIWYDTFMDTFSNLTTSSASVKFGMDAYYCHSSNVQHTGKSINVYTHGNVNGCTLSKTFMNFNEERPISEYPATKYTSDFLKFTE